MTKYNPHVLILILVFVLQKKLTYLNSTDDSAILISPLDVGYLLSDYI
jgi:hypothetical protein